MFKEKDHTVKGNPRVQHMVYSKVIYLFHQLFHKLYAISSFDAKLHYSTIHSKVHLDFCTKEN